MENKNTSDIIEKARQAKSAEELLTLARESGFDISMWEAENFFERFSKSGEVSDDELDGVAGGGCFYDKPDTFADSLKQTYEGKRVRCSGASCPVCGSNQGIVLKTRMTHTGWDDLWFLVYCSDHRNQLILETNQPETDLTLE